MSCLGRKFSFPHLDVRPHDDGLFQDRIPSTVITTLIKGLQSSAPMKSYDFIVGGGSIAGLTFASEAAKRGASVLVLEEHPEIGEPEKCDGLVSLRGLKRYGYEPHNGIVQSGISSAVIHSPDGGRFSVNATALEVVVIDRSEYDKQLAATASANGAEVRTGTRISSWKDAGDQVRVQVGGNDLTAMYYVDSTGPASSPRHGILPAAKYELEGDWVSEHVVEVFLDTERFPGFFAWVIPYGDHIAKVGAAGHGINPFRALDGFLVGKEFRIIRRVSAPIYVGGPAGRFVEGRRILVGESAGQVKPTTAGGIMTSVAGAVMAAKWAWSSLTKDDPGTILGYQREWESAFLKEMKSMLRLRNVLEKLTNSDLEALIRAVATPKLVSKLSRTDFDFHASSLLGLLGLRGLLRVGKVVASAEVRSLLVEP
jgi:digeranylgeranylglycerophospholipid reductase